MHDEVTLGSRPSARTEVTPSVLAAPPPRHRAGDRRRDHVRGGAQRRGPCPLRGSRDRAHRLPVRPHHRHRLRARHPHGVVPVPRRCGQRGRLRRLQLRLHVERRRRQRGRGHPGRRPDLPSRRHGGRLSHRPRRLRDRGRLPARRGRVARGRPRVRPRCPAAPRGVRHGVTRPGARRRPRRHRRHRRARDRGHPLVRDVGLPLRDGHRGLGTPVRPRSRRVGRRRRGHRGHRPRPGGAAPVHHPARRAGRLLAAVVLRGRRDVGLQPPARPVRRRAGRRSPPDRADDDHHPRRHRRRRPRRRRCRWARLPPSPGDLDHRDGADAR